jgi:hypothetical protein
LGDTPKPPAGDFSPAPLDIKVEIRVNLLIILNFGNNTREGSRNPAPLFIVV